MLIAICVVIAWRSLDPPRAALVDDGGDISRSAEGPLTIRIGNPHVLLCVESDRRHVTAFDSLGKVLWHKDILQLVRLQARGNQPARISYLGKPDEFWTKYAKSPNCAAIGLSTKEFGLIDALTGEYSSLGND